MKKTSKKILSLILSVLMIVSVIPSFAVTALATEQTGVETGENVDTSSIVDATYPSTTIDGGSKVGYASDFINTGYGYI